MSLINKMLQDLDARGTPAAGEGYAPQVTPVARRERAGPPLQLVAAGAGGLAVVAALAWFGWQRLYQPAPVSAAVAVPAPARVLPAVVPVSVPVAAPVSAPATHAPEAAVPPSPSTPEQATPAAKPVVPVTKPQPASPVAAVPEQGRDAAPMEPDGDEARATRRALAAVLAARQVPAVATAKAPVRVTEVREAAAPKTKRGAVAAEGRQENTAQRAENSYRRALASLQEGRMGETVAALEETLRIDPAHEAARQTLVGLLVEAGRGDDAIRQLQAGLVRDPRQPALAMLLARLQIERGASGIETLQRTLPYAGNDADYHAFLAGALARQARHREAAEQYLLAVRAAPANGVWWMGLGMSLQAEKRNPEALEAFQKARASGALTAELAGFVERRIQQLAH